MLRHLATKLVGLLLAVALLLGGAWLAWHEARAQLLIVVAFALAGAWLARRLGRRRRVGMALGIWFGLLTALLVPRHGIGLAHGDLAALADAVTFAASAVIGVWLMATGWRGRSHRHPEEH